MKWLPNRGPIVESDPIDPVQLAINHAGAIAMLMSYLHGVPGWEGTTPRELDDLARWLLACRQQYRDGGRWGGELDR